MMVLLGALLGGTVLRFWRIGHQSFWYDESVTRVLLHHSLGGMLNLLPKVEGTPPLYYCLAWFWSRLFGLSEAGVRSLSAVGGVLLIAVLYAAGSKLISRRAGATAAVLASANPFLIWYSQEARAYSLLALMMGVSLLGFAQVRQRRPQARWIAAWALACAASLATHYYGIVAVAPEAAWLLWIHRRDPRVWYATSLIVAAGLALVPLAQTQKSNTAWIATVPLGPRLAQLPAQFLRGTGAPAEFWLEVIGAVAVVIAIALLLKRTAPHERTGALTALGIATGGLVLTLILVAFGVDYLLARNLIAVLLALLLAVAGGLGGARASVIGTGATLMLCAIGVIATVDVATNWRLQRPDWRGAATAAEVAGVTPAGRLLILEDSDSLQPIGTYAPRLHPLHPGGAPIDTISILAMTRGPYSPLCWWGAACHLVHVPLDTSFQMPGFHSAGPIKRVNQFAVYRLVSNHPVHLSRGRLVRALRDASLTSYGLFVTR